MPNSEKVLTWLEICGKNRDCSGCCPYSGELCMENLMADAFDLLKEQEAEIEHLKRPDCEHAEHDGIGCLGYAGCIQDDEPIESCKRCEKYTGNVFEEMSGVDETFIEETIKCHEVERVENLMYKGCESHWHCIHCDDYWPFHCYGKKDLEQMPCPARNGRFMMFDDEEEPLE